jgi:hypothetical protein
MERPTEAVEEGVWTTPKLLAAKPASSFEFADVCRTLLRIVEFPIVALATIVRRYRLMKLHCILLLVGVCVGAQGAVANDAGPDPKVLGTTEALLTYCGKLNPSLAEKSQEQIQQITRGASDEAIAEVRKSEEYRHAHEAVDEALEGVDEKDALKACGQRVGPSG